MKQTLLLLITVMASFTGVQAQRESPIFDIRLPYGGEALELSVYKCQELV